MTRRLTFIDCGRRGPLCTIRKGKAGTKGLYCPACNCNEGNWGCGQTTGWGQHQGRGEIPGTKPAGWDLWRKVLTRKCLQSSSIPLLPLLAFWSRPALYLMLAEVYYWLQPVLYGFEMWNRTGRNHLEDRAWGQDSSFLREHDVITIEQEFGVSAMLIWKESCPGQCGPVD